MRLFTLAVILRVSLVAALFPGGYDHPFDDPAVPDWSDEKVLEYLDDKDYETRGKAGQEILRRWTQAQLVGLLKKDWRKGCEVLGSGGWPRGGVLEDYMLDGGRAFAIGEDESYVSILADGGRVPDGPRFDGRIGGRVRDSWFDAWINRIPRSVFFTGTIDFICARSWCRERLYKVDATWCVSWGAARTSRGELYTPWHLYEYRSVVQIICGDPVDDPERYAKNQFLQYLTVAIRTGRNPCDIELKAQADGFVDLLPTTVGVLGIGPVSYAEMIAVVANKPEWLPAIEARLSKVVFVSQRPVMDGPRVVRVVEKITHEDRRSALISMLGDLGCQRFDAAKESLRLYWKKEWPRYTDAGFSRDLWHRHPWCIAAMLDKTFGPWYISEDRAPMESADPAFLCGEWK